MKPGGRQPARFQRYVEPTCTSDRTVVESFKARHVESCGTMTKRHPTIDATIFRSINCPLPLWLVVAAVPKTPSPLVTRCQPAADLCPSPVAFVAVQARLTSLKPDR